MIVCLLRTYGFCERSDLAPAPNVASVSVKLDLRVGADGDLVLLPVVDLVESTHNPSPCLVAALRSSSLQENLLLYGFTQDTRFQFDEHPDTLMGRISGISTPTRWISLVETTTGLNDAIRTIEDGMRRALHLLIALGNLRMRSSRHEEPNPEEVVYWTRMAIKMNNHPNLTNLPKRTSGMDATIRHLIEHPRLKLAWRHG